MTWKDIPYRIPNLSLDEATAALGRHWKWALSVGITYLAFGVTAVAVPVASSLGLALTLAIMFIGIGALHLIHAVKLKQHQGALMRVWQALLLIAAGSIILVYPGIGLLGISLTLSFYFFVSGSLQWILAQAISPSSQARMWVYIGSFASFLLGFYMVFTFPVSALWLPGTLLGIEFLFSGTGLVGLALATRKLHQKFKSSDSDARTRKGDKTSSYWGSSSRQPM